MKSAKIHALKFLEMRMRRWIVVLAGVLLTGVVLSFYTSFSSRANSPDAELNGAYRRPETNGWTFVHLQGTPHQIGFQNGYLLAPEIEDTLKVIILETDARQ